MGRRNTSRGRGTAKPGAANKIVHPLAKRQGQESQGYYETLARETIAETARQRAPASR